ncbi:jerky protein homolog-like [Ylistrum balloti]|uniref:jerky protein homolog-like n=1 Tax=Ylistrum balloti TaxID=509963 RepID=UPI002905A4A2|nr:jerky protein homolog-like [Ylistrum balloti]
MTKKRKYRHINSRLSQLKDPYKNGHIDVLGYADASYEENKGNDRKLLWVRSPSEELNELKWDWFQRIRAQHIPVSGPILQERALIYTQEQGITETDFKASDGWLQRFRKRLNISFANICDESASVSQDVVSEWKDKLLNIICGYDARDIYSMDETGLFFRSLPDKTLCIRGEEYK